MLLGFDKKALPKKDWILHEVENPEFIVLLPEPATTAQLHFFQRLFQNPKASFYSVLPTSFPKGTAGIAKYYRDHHVDLSEKVAPGVPVICMGRSLFAITESSDFNSWRDFRDHLDTGGNRFYHPKYKTWFFPVPGSFELDLKYNQWFLDYQLKYVKTFRAPRMNATLPVLTTLRDEAVVDFLKNNMGPKEMSWDLETVGFDPWDSKGEIICISISFDGIEGYLIPFQYLYDKKELVTEFFRGKKTIGTNIKFDIRWMVAHYGMPLEVFDIYRDTVVSSHIINELTPHGLKADAWKYSVFGGYDSSLDLFKEKNTIRSYKDIPEKILYQYATMDAIVSYRIYKSHEQVLKNWQVYSDYGWTPYRYYTDIVIPAQNSYLEFELRGVHFDWDKLDQVSRELQEELTVLKQRVVEILEAPAGFNIDSVEQLGKLLEQRGFPLFERAKKGHYKVSEDAVKFWMLKGESYKKFGEALMAYRHKKHLFKSFVGDRQQNSGFYQYRKTDNLLHPQYACMLARSGRNRSSNPNFQNIGNSKDFRGFKSCFTTPSEDYVFVEFDASGLQLRMGAIASQDPLMVESFKANKDLHSRTAQSVLMRDIPLDRFLELIAQEDPLATKARKKAKGINFSLLFGSSAFSFAKESIAKTWTSKEAADYITANRLGKKYLMCKEKYAEMDPDLAPEDIKAFARFWTVAIHIRQGFFETYKGLAEWHKQKIKDATPLGYVISPYGCIRRVTALLAIPPNVENPEDKKLLKHDQNVALNSPIQSWEVCYMNSNLALMNGQLKQRQMKSYFVGNIHDAFLAYVHKEELDEFKDLIYNTFHVLTEFNEGVPLVTEGVYCDPRKGDIWSFQEHSYYKV